MLTKLLTTIGLVFSIYGNCQLPGSKFFKDDTIHTIRIITSNTNFIKDIIAISELDTTIIASIEIDGVVKDSVGFRERSGATFDANKPSMKVDFNFWKSNGNLDGLKAIALRNCVYDPSYIREYFAYKMKRKFGGNGLRTTFAAVYLNNKYLGLYVAVEYVNSSFCKEKFGNGKGNLFKVEQGDLSFDTFSLNHGFSMFGPSILQLYEPKTNEKLNDSADLIRMLKAMMYRNTAQKMIDTLETYWHYDQLLLDRVVNRMIDVRDYYWHNYYIYHNKFGDNKWNFISWDQDLSFWEVCNVKLIDSSFLNTSLVHNAVVYSPHYQNMYYKLVSNFNYQFLNPIKLYPKLDSIIDMLRPWAAGDTLKASLYDLSNKTYNIDSAYKSDQYYNGIIPYLNTTYDCNHGFLRFLGYNYAITGMKYVDQTKVVYTSQLPFKPIVKVKNTKYFVEDSVLCQVVIKHNNVQVYIDSIYLKDVYADSTIESSFIKNFTYPDTGKYMVTCQLINTLDLFFSDDVFYDTFYIKELIPKFNYKIIEVQYKDTNKILLISQMPFKPSIVVKNTETLAVDSILCSIEITHKGNTKYTDSIKLSSILPNISVKFFFNKLFNEVDSGQYFVSTKLLNCKDNDSTDNIFLDTFYILKPKDTVIKSFNYSLIRNYYVDTNKIIKVDKIPFTPKVEIKNTGNTICAFAKCEMKIYLKNVLIYSDSLLLNSKVKDTTIVFPFSKSFNIKTIGTYLVSTSLKNCNDSLLSDNDKMDSFKIESSTDIHELEGNSFLITVWPNPFNVETYFYVEKELQNASLKLSNTYGQLVYEMKGLTGHTTKIVRENLPSGVYYLTLVEHNKIITSTKLIILEN